MKKTDDRVEKKINSKGILALVFLVMLAVICIVNLFVGDKEFSETENRMLEQRPEVNASSIESGRYMDKYEKYKSDQFAGRNFWVSLKTHLDLLAGKRDSNGVFKGKDKYLLEEIAVPDEENLKQNLKAIKDFSEKHSDIPAYMMLVPNAANVLEDKLPWFAVTRDQEKDFERIKNDLGGQIHWVDVSSALKQHKDEEIYYRTDHHWTSLGAYYGFMKLAEAMPLDMTTTPKIKKYVVSDEFNGTLSSKSGYETGYRENISIYAPENEGSGVQVVVNYMDEQKKTATMYDISKLEGKDKYALFFGGNHPLVNIKTTSASHEKLLILKDSYANCMIPFLTPFYREIVVVDPRYYYGNIEELIMDHQITKVLFLYNGNTFAEDSSISGVLENSEI